MKSNKTHIARRTQRVAPGARAYDLVRAADLEALWEAMGEDDFGEDERIPYWAELWPASIPVVRWIEANAGRLAGKIALDLGCGLGLTALAGRVAGAEVVALDYEPAPLALAQESERLNGLGGILWLCADWRQPALAPASIDIAWAGDVFYERRLFEPAVNFLRRVLKPGGEVIVGEPRRSVSASVWDEIGVWGFTASTLATERVPHPDHGDEMTVHLRRLRRG
jgi:predicted nicotinamide N-methyase